MCLIYPGYPPGAFEVFMKFHLGKQGETLASIYRDYYGQFRLDSRWDEGFTYFVICNEHILQTVFLKLNGGEIVLLPTNDQFGFSTESIDASDVV